MSMLILLANILTLLAFIIHTFIGDRELKLLEPEAGLDEKNEKLEKWTMARCGWHWISFDLLFATIGLALINFTSFFNDEKILLQILSIYFLGYALVWVLTIAISKTFEKNYLKLGQWILLLVISGLIYFGISWDSSHQRPETSSEKASNVEAVGAMKNVMWKGELAGTIDIDTIRNKRGLYGLGPVEYLTGELLIMDGKSYVSTVLTDSTMKVEETFEAKAPFFVYANATMWKEEMLPESITNISQLEAYIDQKTTDSKRPFVFKLEGQVETAIFHVQNLPKGATVSSPEEAHKEQTDYKIENHEVDIVGFFSTEHKGIFTHHDSYMHMHLITSDKAQMGHLDSLTFKKGKMKLYLPKE